MLTKNRPLIQPTDPAKTRGFPVFIVMPYTFLTQVSPSRITISVEGTYNDHLVQLPDHFRYDQKSKHVVKGIVQMPPRH